jgi:hypothetical protein
MRRERQALRHEIEAPDIHNLGHGDRDSWGAFLRSRNQHHRGVARTFFSQYELNDTEPCLRSAFANIADDDNPNHTKYSTNHTHYHRTKCPKSNAQSQKKIDHRAEETRARTSQGCNKNSSAQTTFTNTY